MTIRRQYTVYPEPVLTVTLLGFLWTVYRLFNEHYIKNEDSGLPTEVILNNLVRDPLLYVCIACLVSGIAYYLIVRPELYFIVDNFASNQ